MEFVIRLISALFILSLSILNGGTRRPVKLKGDGRVKVSVDGDRLLDDRVHVLERPMGRRRWVNFVSSFTIAVMSSEELNMTDVVSSSTSFSLPSTLGSRRLRSLSADSFMGVRGFFISWVSLLAISRQVASFSALTIWVMSSKVDDIPLRPARFIAQRGEGDAQIERVVLQGEGRLLRKALAPSSLMPLRKGLTIGLKSSPAKCPQGAAQPVVGLHLQDVLCRPVQEEHAPLHVGADDAGRHVVEDHLHIFPLLLDLVLRDLQLPRHPVERAHERPDLVFAPLLEADVEPAPGDDRRPSFTLSRGTVISVAILTPIQIDRKMQRIVMRKRGITKLYFTIFLNGLALLEFPIGRRYLLHALRAVDA